VPSKHKYSPITPRLPTELKDRAQRAVAEMGTDLSSLVTSLLRWYVGDVNELPERPTSANCEDGTPVMNLIIECKSLRQPDRHGPARHRGFPSRIRS
jgi:antitoxin component of RelBE/YafQ-DinJ toxin-antitoxin module